MSFATSRWIALLRGINVGGRNTIPMAELRAACAELGWQHVQTYIQSGNVVFNASGTAATLETDLEQAIQRWFSWTIAVVVRAAPAWPVYIAGNPFVEAATQQPHLVMMALSKAPPSPDAEATLRERAVREEQVAVVGDAIWVHYPDGVASSSLSPALFDRLVGSPVTARNWRTVIKLGDMARDDSA